jgi:predicted small lipoprotein YifL
MPALGLSQAHRILAPSLPEHVMKNRLPARLLWLVLVLAGTGIGLAGCGQKGPLYLPDERPQQQPG